MNLIKLDMVLLRTLLLKKFDPHHEDSSGVEELTTSLRLAEMPVWYL
jgi:hypothetical protein